MVCKLKICPCMHQFHASWRVDSEVWQRLPVQGKLVFNICKLAKWWHTFCTLNQTKYDRWEKISQPIDIDQTYLILCSKIHYNCNDHISISSVFPQFKSTSFHQGLIYRGSLNRSSTEKVVLQPIRLQHLHYCSILL